MEPPSISSQTSPKLTWPSRTVYMLYLHSAEDQPRHVAIKCSGGTGSSTTGRTHDATEPWTNNRAMAHRTEGPRLVRCRSQPLHQDRRRLSNKNKPVQSAGEFEVSAQAWLLSRLPRQHINISMFQFRFLRRNIEILKL